MVTGGACCFSVFSVERGVTGLLAGGIAEADKHQDAEGEPLERVGQVRALFHRRHGERLRHLGSGRCFRGQLPVRTGQQRIAQFGRIRREVNGRKLALGSPALEGRLAVLEPHHGA